MRALLLVILATLAATGCTSDTLDQDTAYRRLVDAYDSESHCITEGDFAVCYQTLTLCTNGRVTMDLVNRPQEGSYAVDGNIARAEFIDMEVVFDLEAQRSAQLPGRHPWQRVEPLVYDCE